MSTKKVSLAKSMADMYLEKSFDKDPDTHLALQEINTFRRFFMFMILPKYLHARNMIIAKTGGKIVDVTVTELDFVERSLSFYINDEFQGIVFDQVQVSDHNKKEQKLATTVQLHEDGRLIMSEIAVLLVFKGFVLR